jgi:hypothetical protein
MHACIHTPAYTAIDLRGECRRARVAKGVGDAALHPDRVGDDELDFVVGADARVGLLVGDYEEGKDGVLGEMIMVLWASVCGGTKGCAFLTCAAR